MKNSELLAGFDKIISEIYITTVLQKNKRDFKICDVFLGAKN
jgi:hypothetical protein